ncbi:MAG: serine/threonine protein phosphatase [Alphaproteobacteria bacterium]|nr:serine/threonine protein phosphatase [Alphaproteobacteria bacterium]
MSERIYAIGDVHGHLDKLRAAHALIRADRALTGDDAAPVIHVGDLVDRGPDSKGVIAYLIDGLAQGAPWICLRGNHDRLLMRFLDDADWRDPVLHPDLTWLHPRMGGLETLASYGVKTEGDPSALALQRQAMRLVPEAHRAFLAKMPLYKQWDNLLFVHAGIRPGVALDAQTEDDLVWIRRPFHAFSGDFGWLIIHGHTMVDKVTHYGNRVDIDTGAGRGNALSAVVIEGRDVWVLTPNGRQAVPCAV